MKRSFLVSAIFLASVSAFSQGSIVAEKPIYTLGEPKTWSAGDASYTFVTADLDKLVAVPTNTSNVFLYPENGTLNTAENQALGAQGFYIDMGVSQDVGTVTTTWEGAAADSYEIYITDVEPTISVLDTEASYSVTGLGQYTEHTAVLSDGARGRYLVFQVTKATNWGWGVKIRSISATQPVDDVLTTFTVSPGFVMLGQPVALSMTFLNQFGMAIPAGNVNVIAGDNAEFVNGQLTILSGTSATLTATMGDTSLTAEVYVAVAPEIPSATSIKTPVFTNGVDEYNSTAEFNVAYNGGAVNDGLITFENGAVAQSFSATRCVFFSNSATTGGWNQSLNPSENGWRSLCLDVFGSKNVRGYIEFESVEGLEGGHTYNFDLKAGEWNKVEVNVMGATKLGNLSIRFNEENKCDILLANIYFTPSYVEGDETAPVLSAIKAEASMTSATLTFSATDDLSENIYYAITVADRTFSVTGISGEDVVYTVDGLQPLTDYEVSVVASDGLNVSEPATITVSTTGMPNSPEPDNSTVQVVYSSYISTELPHFDNWGSAGRMGELETSNGNKVLSFTNYNGQWGGLVDLDMELTFEAGSANQWLHVDVFTDGAEGSFALAPVWADAKGDTPGVTVSVVSGKWTSYDFDLTEFAYPANGNKVIQMALTASTLSSFCIDNLYFWPAASDGIESIIDGNPSVDVVNMQGVVLRRGVDGNAALDGLPAGLYIVGGRKVVVK